MVTRDEFLKVSREIERLSLDWWEILLFVKFNRPDAMAGVLRRIHGGDLNSCDRVVGRLRETLALACIADDAVTVDGKTYPSAHEAVFECLHSLLRHFGILVGSYCVDVLIQADQVPEAWESIREYCRQFRQELPRPADFEARLARERVIVAEQLPTESFEGSAAEVQAETTEADSVAAYPVWHHIVEVIEAAGCRLTTKEVLNALARAGYDDSEKWVKLNLSRMVKAGWLDSSRRDPNGRGYGLLTPARGALSAGG